MAVTDSSMDVDMDIDLTLDDPEIARLQAEAAAFDAPKDAPQYETMTGVEEPPEEGEVDVNALVPKVHVRGVNSFRPSDVDNYASEHFSTDLFKKVEWIDDTSLNLVYDTELAAAEALQAFSAEDVADPLSMRPAKSLSTHPNVQLYVRHAVESDVKVKGAAQHSRFYLDNPEYDPESRKRTYGQRGGRRDYRERDYRPKRQRRDYEDDRYSRRSSTDGPTFDESMYDDVPRPVVQRPESRSSSSDYARRKVKFDEDLFASKQNGRLRDRSASPVRDGDGRYGFNDDQPQRRTARARSPTPPHIRKSRANRDARDRVRKELFPDRKTPSLANAPPAAINGNGRGELFPTQNSAPKELFPNHRRQDAKDLGPEEVTEAIGSYHPFVDGTSEEAFTHNRTSGRRPDNRRSRNGGESRDLFSRISGGPKVESSYGRLQDTDDTEFSIKGAGGKGAESGFSILGASREKVENPLVKELFPLKAGGGNGGGKKDLFDGRIKGRGQRRRAEDLF